jgi:hypothetical protein
MVAGLTHSNQRTTVGPGSIAWKSQGLAAVSWRHRPKDPRR